MSKSQILAALKILTVQHRTLRSLSVLFPLKKNIAYKLYYGFMTFNEDEDWESGDAMKKRIDARDDATKKSIEARTNAEKKGLKNTYEKNTQQKNDNNETREWEKYCNAYKKEIIIMNLGPVWGCERSLPVKDMCERKECRYHYTNFLGLCMAIELCGETPDYSSWSLESYELFISKNLPNTKNYCTSSSPNTKIFSQKFSKIFLGK